MKTRTLLLLAVACGIAVLGAGVGLMVRLANQRDAAPPHRLGETVKVGDASVVVRDFKLDGTDVMVELTVGGVDDPEGGDGFAVVSAGKLALPSSTQCKAFTVIEQPCRMVFKLTSAAGSSVSLVLRRAGEVANWQFAG